MKKIILFVLFGIFFSGNALAEEMVVHLKSGNSLIIQYTGTIQGVTLHGETDAITGMNIQTTANDTVQKQQGAGQAHTATGKFEKANPNNQEKKWPRLKWADPKQED